MIKKSSLSKEEIEEVYHQSNSIKEAAKVLNISQWKLYRFLKQYKISTNCFMRNVARNNISIIELKNDYLNNGLSLAKIMKKYKIRFKNLKQILEENNIVKEKVVLDYDEVRNFYVVEWHTFKQTMEHFKCGYNCLRKFLETNNIRKMGEYAKIRVKKPTRAKIVDYYILENHTLQQSADHFHTGYRNFCRWLKSYKINKPKDKWLESICNISLAHYGVKSYFSSEDFKIDMKKRKPIIQAKVKKTCLKRYGANSFVESKQAKDVWKMGVSNTELNILEKLKEKFPNVVHHYKSERYPYNVDFYIPEIDIFIEYQGFYTHGKEPFDSNNPQHINEKQKLESNPSKFNLDKLKIWVGKDLEKRLVAKENGIKLLEFFSEDSFNKWFNNLS